MDERAWRAAGVAVIVLAVAVGAFIGSRKTPEPLPVPLTPVDTPDAPTETLDITVHVSGAVAAPGLVVLPVGSRVADAVAAAGGARSDAAISAVNLAASLVDGSQVVIPGIDDEAAPQPPARDDGLVQVNRATAAELESLPGVGPVLAQRIVSYRDDNGPFSSVEDLLGVPGIGESKLAALRDQVAVP